METSALIEVTDIKTENVLPHDKELKPIKNWSCDACGGDDETGCLMSDPQDCPYGRGGF